MPEVELAEDSYPHLCAAEDAVIPAHGRALVGTGVAVALPDGFAAFVLRHGITVLNTPGTIDAGDRSESRVILSNTVHVGDRIAQLIIQRVKRTKFIRAERLPGSARGTSRFSQTGGFAPSR